MRRPLALIVLLMTVGIAVGYAQSEPSKNKLPLLINVPADYSSIGEALANNQGQPLRIEVDAREGPFFEADMTVNWDGVNEVSIVSIHGRAQILPRQAGQHIAIRSNAALNGESTILLMKYRENGIMVEGFDFLASEFGDWLSVTCDGCTFKHNRFIGIHVYFAGRDLFLFRNELLPITGELAYLNVEPLVVLCLDEQSQIAYNNITERNLIDMEYPACDYDLMEPTRPDLFKGSFGVYEVRLNLQSRVTYHNPNYPYPIEGGRLMFTETDTHMSLRVGTSVVRVPYNVNGALLVRRTSRGDGFEAEILLNE